MSDIDYNYKELLKKVERKFGTKICFSKSELSEAGNISQSQNNLIIEFLIEILARLDKLEAKSNSDINNLTNQFSKLGPIEYRPKLKNKRDVFENSTTLEKYGTKFKQI